MNQIHDKLNSSKKSILITGASSGIGRALAIEYSGPDSLLILIGRDIDRLREVKVICESKGSRVIAESLDVSDKDLISQFALKLLKDIENVDLIITSAGVSSGTLRGSENIEQIHQIFNINVLGSMNVIVPFLDSMKKNKRGQIVFISSIAGLLGLGSAPSYSASKAAIRVYAEALRADLHPFNIKVNLVIPGFVETNMTKVNNFCMPFIMKASNAAYLIKKGIKQNKSIIAFPFFAYIFVFLFSILPSFIKDPIIRLLPKK